MIRVKGLHKVSVQKKNNKYIYFHWEIDRTAGMPLWSRPLHLSEKDQLNIGPTILVEWEE